jgi:chromosome partitioning protein
MPGKIISVFTNKGGVGKTTTALSIAHGLAKKNVKTLLIDIDAQCNATEPLLGIDPSGNVLEILEEKKTVEECVHRMNFQNNLSCIPNAEGLTSLEPALIRQGEEGFYVLRKKITDYCKENFDITIIDCPPNFGIFVINALFCSELAIVPTESGSRNSVKGLQAAQKFIAEMNEAGNPDLTLFKILVTKLDMRTNIGKDYLSQMKDVFQENVFENHIPACVDFKYAENANKTIFQGYPKSSGAKAYMKVVSEITNILGL